MDFNVLETVLEEDGTAKIRLKSEKFIIPFLANLSTAVSIIESAVFLSESVSGRLNNCVARRLSSLDNPAVPNGQ
jgi:hypothetical protein